MSFDRNPFEKDRDEQGRGTAREMRITRKNGM